MSFRAVPFIPIILICLLIGGSSSRVKAQQSEESLQPCLDHKKRVQTEVSQQPLVDWKGDYELSMQAFSVAPSTGFYLFRGSDYRYWSCAWGRVEFSEGLIKLIPDHTVPAEGMRGIALNWTPVVWGDRHYLVATDALLDFVNSVNNGYEPSFRGLGFGGSYFKKKGDENIRVSGVPNVPQSYRRYLLTKPIRGNVKLVGNFNVEKIDDGKSEVRTTTVTLDVGSKQGVMVGMRFVTYKPQRVHENIIVTNVFENSSEAIVRQEGSYHDVPSTKWKISTSIRDIK